MAPGLSTPVANGLEKLAHRNSPGNAAPWLMAWSGNSQSQAETLNSPSVFSAHPADSSGQVEGKTAQDGGVAGGLTFGLYGRVSRLGKELCGRGRK